MAIGRGRYAPPYVSTKGHSVLKQRSYGMPIRTPLSTGVPRTSGAAYDTRAEDFILSDRVKSVNYLSNSTLDEGYDTAKRSRGRDQQLLKEATNAIPRGSLRKTSTAMSSTSPFGPRFFPRRFGKPTLRKNQSASFYGTRLPDDVKGVSTSGLMASAGPASSGSWRRYGSVRAASVARSNFGDGDASPTVSAYSSRASSVGPCSTTPPSSNMRALIRSSSPLSSLRSRQSLPPYPMSKLSESKLLDSMSRRPWGQSLSPPRSNYTPRTPLYIASEPLDLDSDPDISPSVLPRRRKVLGTGRRSAGNYYQRLLKKRGKQKGRLGPYYDVESIDGSDLSGVLSDQDSLDGTYDKDSDCESGSVSFSSHRYPYTTVSPSSPYYVDQDTEFVPFKPSRPLQTKGLLELSPSNDDDDELSNSDTVPSPTTDLSLSRYIPSDLVTAAISSSKSTLTPLPYSSLVPDISSPRSTLTPLPNNSLMSDISSPRSTLAPTRYSSVVPDISSPRSTLTPIRYSSVLPSTSSLTSSLPPLPYRSVMPYTPSLSADSLAVPSSSTPSQQLLDSLVSSSVHRAKSALTDMAIPEYSGASLLLSVEGAGLSPEGKRVDFTYTPPPIPLYGRGLGLDASLLGIRPTSSLKPLDNFISGYMERMRSLRSSLNDNWEANRDRRLLSGLKSTDTGSGSSRASTPSYRQSYEYVPVKHLSSNKLEQLPVTTFRRRHDDGRTQRVDVFSLGEYRPRLSSSASRAITLPSTATGAGSYQLSVLDKINIKVSSESYATPQTSVASRRVTRGRSLAPRAASVPPRPLKAEVDSIATSTNTTTATSTAARAPAPTPVSAKRPIVVLPGQAAGRSEDRAKSVSPVVVFMEDKPRRPLVEPTHVRDDWRSKARARSVPPQAAPSVRSRPYVAAERVRPARVEPSFQAALPTSDLRAHKVPRRFLTRTGFRTAFSSLQGYYQPGQLASDRQANDDRYDIKKSVAKARVIASPVAPNTVDRAQGGYRPLQVLPTPKPCPIQESLSEFPKVFVPSKSRKPSNRAKAAIIASKMEPDPLKRRRPRSEYAANKYRELRRETQDSTYGGNASYASSAPVQTTTQNRTMETEDIDQPRSIMSWKYRLDSVMSPKDLLYQPASLTRIREQLKNTREKMIRHREMLDKYLPEGDAEAADVASSIRRRMAAVERRDPVGLRPSRKETAEEEVVTVESE